MRSAHGDPGDARAQLDLLERALRIQEKEHGKNDVQVATALTNLGNAHGALGDLKTKRDMLESALRIQEAHHGQNH
jgi:hypothetical protein